MEKPRRPLSAPFDVTKDEIQRLILQQCSLVDYAVRRLRGWRPGNGAWQNKFKASVVKLDLLARGSPGLYQLPPTCLAAIYALRHHDKYRSSKDASDGPAFSSTIMGTMETFDEPAHPVFDSEVKYNGVYLQWLPNKNVFGRPLLKAADWPSKWTWVFEGLCEFVTS